MRTYAYGAKAPTLNAHLVERQLILAHRYRNDLVAIERKRLEERDTVIRPHVTARAVECARLKESGVEHPKLPKFKLPDEDQAKVDAIDEASYLATKVCRQTMEDRWGDVLAWGTYLRVDEDMRRVCESIAKERFKVGGDRGTMPRFVHFTGEGLLAVQLQGGMSVAELLGGLDTQARLTGEGMHRVLHLRIGSTESRRPVWATFPVCYHREIPPHARAKQVWVSVWRVATKLRYGVRFSLEGEHLSPLPSPDKGSAGLGTADIPSVSHT
jgi:hypothetical protein